MILETCPILQNRGGMLGGWPSPPSPTIVGIDRTSAQGQHASMKMRHCLWLVLLAGCSRGESAAKPKAPVVAEAAEDAATTKAVEPEAGSYAIKVRGEYVPWNSYRFTYNAAPFVFGQIPADQRKVVVLEILLQRELLAQAAVKRNFRVSDETVRESIEAGELYLLGHKVDGKKVYFREDASGETEFAPEYLENLVRGRLGLASIADFYAEQRREHMAAFTRDMIEKSETVTDKEVRDFYIVQNSNLDADYIKFDVRHYQSQLRLDRAMVQGYVDTHEAELRAEWHKTKPRWESDRERIELSILKVARDGVAPKVGRKKIQSALDKIRKGAKFETVAAKISQDRSSGLGGYVGWRPAQAIGYGQEVVNACEGLAAGAVSEIIETPSAYYLVRIEKRSDKGLHFEQMKFSLGIRAAPKSLARMFAKKAAEDALASPLPLEKQYPVRKQASPSIDPSSLPPEIRDQLTTEQLAQLMSSIPAADADGPPALRRMQNIQRDQEAAPDVGYAKEFVKALWGDVAIGARVPTVFEVDDGNAFVVARIAKRTEANMAAFAKRADEIREALADGKGDKALREWVVSECRELLESKAVLMPNAELLVSSEGKEIPYEPCAMLME